jgi:hypothetical protein
MSQEAGTAGGRLRLLPGLYGALLTALVTLVTPATSAMPSGRCMVFGAVGIDRDGSLRK